MKIKKNNKRNEKRLDIHIRLLATYNIYAIVIFVIIIHYRLIFHIKISKRYRNRKHREGRNLNSNDYNASTPFKSYLKFPKKKCFVKILKFIDTRHNTFPSIIIKMRLFSHIFKLKCINYVKDLKCKITDNG